MKTQTSTAVSLIILISLLLAPSQIQADQQASSELLLPFFEVDLDAGLTTLFAVTNGSEQPASFEITIHSNWGIPILRVPQKLEGGEVLSVNLTDWIANGRLPDTELYHLSPERYYAALGAPVLGGVEHPPDTL